MRKTQIRAGALSIGHEARRQILRQILPAAFALGFVLLFADRLPKVSLTEVLHAVRAVAFHQWVAAVGATVASFWAVGRYDAIVHAVLRSGIPSQAARRAGIAAIAVSQTVGFGLLTGALARWRLLPEMTFWQALRISTVVALSFLAGWAVVSATTLLVLPTSFSVPLPLLLLPVAGFCGLIALSLFQPPFVLFGQRRRFPPVQAILQVLVLTLVDTLSASAALFVLLPEPGVIQFGMLYPAYLLALGAALVSGTPGGVGPFEVTLLALLPAESAVPLVAAILAFRAVYYGVPAVIGGLCLLIGPEKTTGGTAKSGDEILKTGDIPFAPALPHYLERLVRSAPRAEANLLRQGNKQLLARQDGAVRLVTGETGQALVALSDPINTTTPDFAVSTLMYEARARSLVPCLYKCGARLAVAARRAKWFCLPVAEDAVIATASYTAETPARRQLRRKLRKAGKCGVTVRPAGALLPLEKMADISQRWVRENGGERGFSMGVFCPQYLHHQQVFLAHHGGRLAGFVSFNTCRAEWALDLMRLAPDAPEGTMHALVHHAIGVAAIDGVARVSLAAVPAVPTGHGRAAALAARLIDHLTGGRGLRQFKAAFAPKWESLYIAAPGYYAVLLAGFDIARAISAPRHLSHIARQDGDTHDAPAGHRAPTSSSL